MVLTLAIVGIAGLAQGFDERGLGYRARFVGHGRRRQHSLLKRGQGHAGVPLGPTGQLGDELRWDSGSQAGQASRLVGQCTIQDERDLVPCKRLQDGHAAAGEQGRVDLERGVLGRGADERDRSLLDGVQERILLGLVEAVDLVDEEDDPAATAADLGGLVD